MKFRPRFVLNKNVNFVGFGHNIVLPRSSSSLFFTLVVVVGLVIIISFVVKLCTVLEGVTCLHVGR